jgi:hypothetical protein
MNRLRIRTRISLISIYYTETGRRLPVVLPNCILAPVHDVLLTHISVGRASDLILSDGNGMPEDADADHSDVDICPGISLDRYFFINQSVPFLITRLVAEPSAAAPTGFREYHHESFIMLGRLLIRPANIARMSRRAGPYTGLRGEYVESPPRGAHDCSISGQGRLPS